nr:cellulose biosynthesis protein BcsS [Methylosinus sp. Sm6]
MDASADSLRPPPGTPAPPIAPTIEITSLSTSTTRRIWDQYLEGTLALQNGLDQSGPRARLGLGFGRYDYPIAGTDVPFSDFGLPWLRQFGKISGRYQEGAFLVGYELVGDRYALLGLVGAGVQHHSLSQPDPENPVRGTRWGFNVVGEVDAYPTDQTMFFGYGMYSTAFQSAYIDARPGYLVLKQFNLGTLLSATNIYVGPQGIWDSNRHERIWKVGAHLTISEFGPFHATFAGGYAYDNFNRSGAYGLVETSVRF